MLTRKALVPLTSLLVLCACAKQGSEENGDSTGGTTSIFGKGGSGSTGATGQGGGGMTSTDPTVIWADPTTNQGLSGPMPPNEATNLITNPESACSGWTAEPESAGSVLEFIVDVSGSMGLTAPTTGGATKWGVTKQALESAMQSMPSTVAVGMTFFPNMAIQASSFPRAASACVNAKDNVPIAPMDANQKQLIIQALERIQISNQGATPTHDAYNIALAELKASTAPGDKYLALITDGQPTQSLGCVGTGITCTPEPTDPIVTAITSAQQDDGIKTFIVGSPGSDKNDCTNLDVRGWLSAAARAGDTATDGCSDSGPFCHFDESQEPDFGAALTKALNAIVSGVITCDFDVPSAPDGQTLDLDISRINLIYWQSSPQQQVLVLPSNQADCTVGWQFTDSTRRRLHVCQDTCKQIQSDFHASMTLLFGCAQGSIPIQ